MVGTELLYRWVKNGSYYTAFGKQNVCMHVFVCVVLYSIVCVLDYDDLNLIAGEKFGCSLLSMTPHKARIYLNPEKKLISTV